MYTNPTLTADEFKNVHNALWELDCLAQSLEDVLKPEKFVQLQKAKTAIRAAFKRAYDEESQVFSQRSDYFDDARSELKCRSIWSLYEVADLYAEHPFAGAQVMLYKDHWGDKPVSVPLAGRRWVDLWIAADHLIKASGDEHHVFIEQFKPFADDNTVLTLQTGS